MRIISGQKRGTRLVAPPGLHTRPTADRVKESVFSTLQFEICGRLVLDGFAGSGALGLEALSRGARKAYFVENDPKALRAVEQNIRKTGFGDAAVLIRQELIRWLSGYKDEPFDLVFLDPPYGRELEVPAIRLLLERRLVRSGGRIVVETSAAEQCSGLEELIVLTKRATYGNTAVCFYTVPDGEE